jgi:TetR/AcrR family transcriptional regulator, transcriptional repressor for nem operon
MGRTSDARQRLMGAINELIWTGSFGSTTIDLICEKAGVKKGSFYHFFESKADLAIAALEANWETRRPEMDAAFSPTVPPLERLRRFGEQAYQKQADIKAKYGAVLGCPLYSLGAEVCTQEGKLRGKIQEILDHYRKYLETAIRDAAAEGLLEASNPAEKARMLFAYYEGLLTQARIQNDVNVLREMAAGFYAVLGIKKTVPLAA